MTNDLVSSTISGKRRGRCEQLEIERNIKDISTKCNNVTLLQIFHLSNPAVKRH